MHPGILIGLLLAAVVGIASSGSSKDTPKKQTKRLERPKRQKPATPRKVTLESALKYVMNRGKETEKSALKVLADSRGKEVRDPNVDDLRTTSGDLVSAIKYFETLFSGTYPQLLGKYHATKRELKELKEVKPMISTAWKIVLFSVAVIFIFGFGVALGPRLTETYNRFNQTEIVLSEDVQELFKQLRRSYLTQLDVAKVESLITFNQDQLAFHQLVSDQASGLLHQAKDGQDITIGTGAYSAEEVLHDWELRQPIIFEIQNSLRSDQRKLAEFEDSILGIDRMIQDQSARLVRLNRQTEVDQAELVALMSVDPAGRVKITRHFDLVESLGQAGVVFLSQLEGAKDIQGSILELEAMVRWEKSAIPDSQWEKLPPIQSARQQLEEERRVEEQRLAQERENNRRLAQEEARRRTETLKVKEQRLAQEELARKAREESARKAEAQRLIQEENGKLSAMGSIIFTGRVISGSFYDTGIIVRGKGLQSDELHVTHTSGKHYNQDAAGSLVFVFAPEGSDNDFLTKRRKEGRYSGGLIERRGGNYSCERSNSVCVFVSSNPNKEYDHLYVLFDHGSPGSSVDLKMTIERLAHTF